MTSPRSVRCPVTAGRRALLPAVGALLLMACGSNGPVTPVPTSFDVAAVIAGLDALEGTLGTAEWESFAHLAGAFRIPAAPLAPGPIPARGAAVPIVPPTSLGSTFVHDGEGYVVDEERDGAPADGVRFVLYAIDEQTSEPQLSVELGHADVRDIGVAIDNGFALAIEAVTPSAGTVLDYTASFELGEGSASLVEGRLLDHDGIELAGRVSDGVEELRFELVTGEVNSTEITDLDLTAGGITVIGLIGHDQATGIVDVDFSFTAGDDELRVVGGGAGDDFAATISLNWAGLASATGLDQVEIAPVAGVELSAAQIMALRRLVMVADFLLEFTHILVEPTELS